MSQKGDLELRFAWPDGKEISAEYCGLGLQEVLLLLYFILRKENEILLIEEPENHLHPEMQRALLRFLAVDSEKQVILTTHSSVFLNPSYVNRVFLTEFKDEQISLSDVTSRSMIIRHLGSSVTDNLVSDLIILVKGAFDKDFFEEFLSKLDLDTKFNIKFSVLGGSDMKHQDLSVYKQNCNVVAIIDRDNQDNIREEFVDKCRELGISCRVLQRYSLESYYTHAAINSVFNKFTTQYPEVFNLSAEDFAQLQGKMPIWENLPFDPKSADKNLGHV